MTAEEYLRLYRYFDPSGNKKITYNEWNNVVGNMIHPLSDIAISRPDTPRLKEWTRRALVRAFADQITNPADAFEEVNKSRSGLISHQEFNAMLRNLNVPFGDDEETFYLFKKYQDKSTNKTGQMTKEEFVALFADFTKSPAKPPPSALTAQSLDAIKRIFTEKVFIKYNAVNKIFKNFKGKSSQSNLLSYAEMRRGFADMNLTISDAQARDLEKWFDPEGKGHITYADFNNVLGPIILPNAKDTSRTMEAMERTSGAQDGLTFNPGARLGNNRSFEEREAERLAAKVIIGAHAPSPGLPWDDYVKTFRGTAGFDSVSPSPKGDAGFGGAAAAASIAAAAGDYELKFAAAAPAAAASSSAAAASSSSAAAAPAAAAAPVDVNKLEERLRKALGRGWVHAAADIKKRGAAVPADAVRDILAERAVPMTSREAAALAARYAAPTGGIDANKMLTHVFKAAFAGAELSKPKAAAPAPAARAAPAPAAAPAPSAFVKGATKKSVSIF